MEYITKGYQPEDALRYFEEIAQIPHGSYNEEAVSQYLVDFAAAHGIECYRDELFNVFMKKPGSKGCENLPPILIQGHTDMVCEKNNDTVHDFTKDPLKLRIEDGWLKASGTTLGADNANAVVYMMALLARNDLKHPPLECLFTVREEVGLEGAFGFDCSRISAKRLLNMDAGPEGYVLVSAAGGLGVTIEKPNHWIPFAGASLALRVRGLDGGHSGSCIHQEKGNSNKIMARVLHEIKKECAISLINVDGGSKMNAIPREGDVLAALPADQLGKAVQIAKKVEAEVKAELAVTDAGFRLEVEENPAHGDRMFCPGCSAELIDLMYLLPYGVRTMSMEIPGLVICSVNEAVVKTEEEKVVITMFIRSADGTIKANLGEEICTLAEKYGASHSYYSDFPGWKYEKDSAFRQICMDVYKKQTGKDLVIKAVHGGLECGVFKDRIPDLDIVTMGPLAMGAHTPEEKLNLASFERVWNFLVELLETLCK